MRLLNIGFVILAFAIAAIAADNLKLNPHLDYDSDSADGPLITGDHMDSGAVSGKPNYVIIYGEQCYNSKRQARRTVSLYDKYKGRVNFVIVDLDRKRSAGQDELVRKFYGGAIPHVVVLARDGRTLYNDAGEISEEKLAALLDEALR